MSNWIEWNGGECPVSEDTKVEAELAGGSFCIKNADYFFWKKFGSYFDIVKYRVVEELNQTPEVKTLRDEFAMAALTGWLSDPSACDRQTTAKICYEFADAMMKERTK